MINNIVLRFGDYVFSISQEGMHSRTSLVKGKESSGTTEVCLLDKKGEIVKVQNWVARPADYNTDDRGETISFVSSDGLTSLIEEGRKFSSK